MRRLAAMVSLASLAMLGGAFAQSGPAPRCANVIYVAVPSDGTVIVDDQATAIASITDTLARLKPASNYVLFYRTGPAGNFDPAQAARVIDVSMAIAGLKLPVAFNATPDFSNATDEHGHRLAISGCPGSP